MENQNNQIKSFKDLKVWQEAHVLVILIYKITKDFPKEETYSLTDQMRRSSSSISSNIAEGFGRQTYKDKVHFFYQAQGSLTELEDQLLISKDVGYLNQADFMELIEQTNLTHRLLQGLITKSKSFIVNKKQRLEIRE